MRNGLPFSKPRVRLYGATGEAQNYLGAAYNLLYKVRQFCEASGTPVFAMQHSLPDGAMVQAAILGNEEIVSCYPPSYQREVPELPKEKFPLRGAPGPVFLHESLLPSFRHQGLVGVSVLGGYAGFTQVDAPWPGQASRSFKRVFDKSAGVRDERAIYNGPTANDYRFGPHAISYSEPHKVHVQVSRMLEVGGAFMPSTVFVAGVPALQSTEVDFVGARLYRDFLAFAFVLYQGGQAYVCFSTRSLDAIAPDQSFLLDDLEAYPHIAVLGTSDETIVNYSPMQYEALFLSGGQRVEVTGGVTEFLFDYSFGGFFDGVPELFQQQTGVCGRRIKTETFSAALTTHYESHITRSGSGGDTVNATSRSEDYALSIPIPIAVELEVDVVGAPIWCGYSEEGEALVYRLYGEAHHHVSGALSRQGARTRFFTTTGGPPSYSYTESSGSRTDTNAQPLEALTWASEIHINSLDGPVEATVRIISCGAVANQSVSAAADASTNTTPTSRIFAPSARKFVEQAYIGAVAVDRNFGVVLSNGAGTYVVDAPGGTDAYTFTCAAAVDNSCTVYPTQLSFFERPLTTVSARRYVAQRATAYQAIQNEDGAASSVFGDLDDAFASAGDPLVFSFTEGYEFINEPVPTSGGAALYPVEAPTVSFVYPAANTWVWSPAVPGSPVGVPDEHIVYDTTWTATLTVQVEANVRDNLFVSNRLQYGCLFDAVANGHVLSDFGLFVSPFSSVVTPNKTVFLLSGPVATDITPQILAARPDEDGSARPPQQSVDWNTSDVFIPRGMI